MNYLFGRPVRPSLPSAVGHRDLFVLGAYPSALHVEWRSPSSDWRIRAVAVDNEPEPFWTGYDEAERISRWSAESGFNPSWGTVGPCGRLNGSSGVWVEDRILRPLGVNRSSAWITDCLDTYFESAGAAARLEEPAVVDLLAQLGIVQRRHRPHPSENEIVRDALGDHSKRLLAEIHEASPARLVTLGNAALRVVAALAEAGSRSIRKLSPSASSYGKPIALRIGEQAIEWIPLAHPASPAEYQQAHEHWIAGSTH